MPSASLRECAAGIVTLGEPAASVDQNVWAHSGTDASMSIAVLPTWYALTITAAKGNSTKQALVVKNLKTTN